jgi:carbon-monoxide dehydrogenase medium subunit
VEDLEGTLGERSRAVRTAPLPLRFENEAHRFRDDHRSSVKFPVGARSRVTCNLTFDTVGAVLLPKIAYARPDTIEEAVGLLSEHENARVLAGGQTLVNVMKLRFAAPDVVVDIGRIQALKEIRVGGDGSVELGAMATYDDIVRHERLAEVRPILAQVAGVIADQQVRNRGTIGGNVCSSDPTNHFPPLMVALGAAMTIVGPRGERTVPCEEFFAGVYVTAVEQGELLTRIQLPPPAQGEGTGFASMTIGKEGTGIVNVAASVRCNARIESAAIAIGCVSAIPVRAEAMERALAGKEPTEASVRLAAQGLGATLDPPGDVHASADFRRHLAEVMAVRATVRAIDRAIR